MSKRRSIRSFAADAKISDQVIEQCVSSALHSPSGANQQPWHYVVIKNPEMKAKLRKAVEEKEREFYTNTKFESWRKDVKGIATGAWMKPHLEEASHIIIPFVQMESYAGGAMEPTHYPVESVGISVGILISALQFSGVATLVHTTYEMDFLNGLLGRPKNEKPFAMIIAGQPKTPVVVPNITRKQPTESTTWL